MTSAVLRVRHVTKFCARVLVVILGSSLRVRKKGSFGKGVFLEKSISRDSRELGEILEVLETPRLRKRDCNPTIF